MLRLTAFGLVLTISRPEQARPHRKIKQLKAWTRKGTCPGCNVQTGSKHSSACPWRDAQLKGLE